MNNLRFGVTGSTGMLGVRLVDFLAKNNCRIICLVRNTSRINQLISPGIQFFYGDVQDYSSLKAFIANIDVCLHLAAHVDYADKETYYKINILGTDNICRAILEFNPPCKLVYCSSIAALRLNKFFKFLATNYAISKYQAEKRVLYHIKKNNLKADIVYSGIIYGPGDTKFIPAVIKNLKEKKLFFVSGGEKNAPLSYIDDLCELLYKAGAKANANHKYLGIKKTDIGIHTFIKLLAEKVNIPQPSKKYAKVFLMIIAIIGEGIHTLFKTGKQPALTKRVIDILSANVDYDKYHMDNHNIDWVAQTDIEDGLNKALEWLKAI